MLQAGEENDKRKGILLVKEGKEGRFHFFHSFFSYQF